MTIKPFISSQKKIKELTFKSLGLGVIFSFFFALANTYLGLKIGQTVSASIPAAVLSLGLCKALFRKKTSILEHNIIQTIATMGEGMAGGLVFTLPALLLLGDRPPFFKVFLLAILGGLLGILLMIPMRRFLIVEEHKTLPYPEGTACAEILKASTKAGKNAFHAVYGFILSAIYKVFISALFLWNEIPSFVVRILPGTKISLDGSPALLGLGYLIGFRICTTMLAGGLLAWLVIIPLIHMFSGDAGIIYPATTPISHMTPDEIWSNYIRYIGAGAVGTGGVFHLFKVIPLLGRAFKDGAREFFTKSTHTVSKSRTDHDISMKWLIVGVIGVAITLFAVPYLSFNLFSVALLLVLSILFVSVSSIACGVVGSSSSPVSGMLITVLLITCGIYLSLGWTERVYLFSAITLSVVACVAIGLASNTSQDLKTGYLLGSTPWKQQVAQILGLILPAFVIGYAITILNETYTIGSTYLPAPQANLLAMIAEGVIEKTLPVTLVTIGVALAILLGLTNVPVIPFAIGLYLPLSLSAGVFVGGLARLLSDHKQMVTGKGTLFASGLVGGDAIFGVLIAILTILDIVPIEKPYLLPSLTGPIAYGLLGLILVWIGRKRSV